MTIIVNLSTTHDYSLQETVFRFVKLCNKYSDGCLQCMPWLLQTGTNYAWVMAKYELNRASLIDPYRLGKISTPEFLNNLAKILYFMDDVPGKERLLEKAWNASITMSDTTQDRLLQLARHAEQEPVYLISNSNELNIEAILILFRQQYPDLPFFDDIDTSIKNSKKPIEILPNVFLCLSYRFQTFKTDHLLEQLVQKDNVGNFTVVSQYDGDIEKAKQLGISDVRTPEQFYDNRFIQTLGNY